MKESDINSMALYHLSVKYISRGKGRSSVSAAAYRSGEKLHNFYDGLTHDFTRKKGIMHTEILLPKNAPREYLDRNTLWNAVEKSEKRSDSRTAREIEVALPNELTLEEQIELVKSYVLDNFISKGMCADIAIHNNPRTYNKGILSNETAKEYQPNPHAHILLTTRPVGRDGFHCKKERNWDKRENVLLWRKQWAEAQNKELERKGLDVRVTHESYAQQGIDQEPTRHLGPNVINLERRNIRTDRGNKNREITARNEEKKRKQKEREKRQHELQYDRSR